MVTQEELEKMSPEEIAELQRKNCIFCKIISGEIPSSKILENKTTVSILDINPARNGHALVMPKEHFPILPLVPPETFKHMFLDAKLIATSIKKKTLAGSTSIFIANGALAGQQSPHFLFHVIPDQKFSLEGDGKHDVANEQLASALQNNLGIMMSNHAKREGMHPPNQSPTQAQPISAQDAEKKREQIAKIIQENKDVRDLLRHDVQKFKDTINQHDQLKALFEGVDLQALSDHLQSLPETQEPQQSPQKNQEEDQPMNPATSSVAQYANSSSSPKESPIFLGADPQEQKKKIMEYFDEKPKAKELLMDDVETFKELLSKREDVQPLFADVNIELLAQELRKQKGDTRD